MVPVPSRRSGYEMLAQEPRWKVKLSRVRLSESGREMNPQRSLSEEGRIHVRKTKQWMTSVVKESKKELFTNCKFFYYLIKVTPKLGGIIIVFQFLKENVKCYFLYLH